MKKKILYIYIDESGDFGFSYGSSKLYVVSFVFYEGDNIYKDVRYLEEKLLSLGHKGMVHTALLVARKNEYNKLDLKIRKDIFYTLYNFARRVPIKFKSVLIDKNYINTRHQLKKKIEKQIEEVIENNCEYFNKFHEIVIYYDNGQDSLGNIINKVFRRFNVKRIIDFDHEKERLFQVVDMLTIIDKLDYKNKKKMQLSKYEKSFFESYDKVSFIVKDFINKRLK